MKAARAPQPAPAFAGFGPHSLDFFRALGFHQDRTWFEENRILYETEVRAPLEALLARLTTVLGEAGLPLRGDARSIFRLHRDVRFGRDKRPYKTNGGAVLTRDGTKKSPGLLYIHLDPEGCFMAAGFYQPGPEELAAIRRRIARSPAAFGRILDRLDRAGLTLSDGDPLSRSPRGFEEIGDPVLSAAIRNRSFVVRRALTDATILRPDLVEVIVAFAAAAEPLLRFGWDSIEPTA